MSKDSDAKSEPTDNIPMATRPECLRFWNAIIREVELSIRCGQLPRRVKAQFDLVEARIPIVSLPD
jgi:hypothetical protein